MPERTCSASNICFSFFNHRTEFSEQRRGIVRAGRSFRMVLHTENGFGFVPHTLDGLVIEIYAINYDLGGKAGRVHGEPMILGGDFNASGFEILHRLVASTMTK